MPSRTWIRVTFSLPSSHHDLLTGQLAEIGFEGFLQNEASLASYVRKPRWTASFRLSLGELLAKFRKEFRQFEIPFSTKVIREQNWNASWERSAGIVEATPGIIIKPSWKKLRRQDRNKMILHIDPKMSFGTGHHETTRLCLALLERYVEKGMSVLDFGCGTGVLSIAAAKLGARRVVAVDNDEWATMNSFENVRKNRVQKIVKVASGGLGRVPRLRFDLILSNIDFSTNLRFLPIFLKRLAPEGVLIVSGLLSSDLSRFLDSLAGKRVVPVELIGENEWVAVTIANIHASQRH